MPVLRTKLIRLIAVNEYAIVFIGAGIVETLGRSGVGAAANAIYNASLNFFPGLIFMVFALIGLFPIAIMWYACHCTRTVLHVWFSFSYLAFLQRRPSKSASQRTKDIALLRTSRTRK